MAQPNDFGFGKEEEMLKSEARKFFKENCDELKLADLVATDPDPHRKTDCLWDKAVWAKMVALEWTTLAIPESAGGIGMSTTGVAALVEEAGRAALPSPLNVTINAAYVLSACETTAAEKILTQIAGGRTASLAVTDNTGSWNPADTGVTADKTNGSITLSGTAWFVQDAGKVGGFIVSARSDDGVGLYAVPANATGVTIVPDAIVDLTRDQAHIEFQNVSVDAEHIVASPGQGDQALDKALPAIFTMIAADMCGAGEWQLQATAAYARERKQFDRPIGFFQAVKHPLVNMMMMIDEARSLMYNAACAWDHEPDKCRQYAHMAKAAASDMAAFCSGRSIQLHGGFGFTWESAIHIYFKRQLHNQVLLGDGAYHRACLADMLIGPTK